MKEALTSSPVLALFDPNLDTVISADASSFGFGAVLLQKLPTGDFKPVTYISRSMTPTEQRYAQIEKEALTFTWACERLADYLISLKFHIQTDHQPLVPLFSSKHLKELPVRVQRFRLRMMRFQFTIGDIPGKELTIANTLSRAPTMEPTPADEVLQQETQALSMQSCRVCQLQISAWRRLSGTKATTRCARRLPPSVSQDGPTSVLQQPQYVHISLCLLNSLWRMAC